MSDATGYAMMNSEDYQHLTNKLADSMAAESRQRRREAALDRLEEGDTVRYDLKNWLLIEIHDDGRVVLESWDEIVTVEPTKVGPAV